VKRLHAFLPAIVLALLLSVPAATASHIRSGVVRLFTWHKRHHTPERYESPESGGFRVIFRSPSSWNSSFWIGAGERDGVELDSPVVSGDLLVGVVDHVGARHSRVRLLTDSGLAPAVRVLRDGQLLAKGELSGSSAPLWRGAGKRLKGTGFNYDRDDEAGAARDLRTGVPKTGGPSTPLIEEGDLLVTSGLDGVFPPGLRVAAVADVETLREGAYFYSLMADPLADFEELQAVQLLPAQGFAPRGVERAIR
jgi:rod shape-determining protein MreC